MLSQARLLPIILLSMLLTACGGGGGGNDGASPPNSQNSNNNAPPSSTETNGSATPPTSSNPQTTITVSWIAPLTRENGTPLPPSEISGYEIYYFRDGSPTEEDGIIIINDPNTLKTQTPPLVVGTYYFAIATIDSQGVYSEMSDHVEISIN